MIAKEHRFHGLGSLRFVFSKGSAVREQYLMLKYSLHARRKSYRLSVVVSRKIHKSAVVRNRIRRRIYEQVRLRQAKITKPYDLVITAYSDQLAKLPAGDLERSVDSLLKKAKII
jgi:ribonuclease P protein component